MHYTEEQMLAEKEKSFNEGLKHSKQSPETKIELVRIKGKIEKNSDIIEATNETLKEIKKALNSTRNWVLVTLLSSLMAATTAGLSIGQWKGTIDTKLEALQLSFEKHIESR